MREEDRPTGDTARGDPGDDREPPPILGSWRNLYLLVAAGWLAAIALCAWIARHNG